MQGTNELWNMFKDWAFGYGVDVFKAVVILVCGLWIINKFCRISMIFLRQTNLEIGLISFFSSILKFFLRTILILLLLPIIGVNATSVITAIGASIVTIGLMLKDSISNFVSGILIIVNKPIRVGDYIEFENVKGTVTKIEMMFTTLRSPDDGAVIIPNFRLSSNNIIRKSPYDICRYNFYYVVSGVHDGIDISQMFKFLLASNEKILQLPPPTVDCKVENQESGVINVTVNLFCEKRYAGDLEKELIISCKGLLKKHGISINPEIYPKDLS